MHRRYRWTGNRFNVLALPDRTLTAHIDYVAAAIDPATRRLLVRPRR